MNKFLIIIAALLITSPATAQVIPSGAQVVQGTEAPNRGYPVKTIATDGNGNAVTPAVVAQGSTTSGQNGELMQCAVTTAAPLYVTATTNPFSCDTSGGQRVTVNGKVTTSTLATYTNATPNPIALGTGGQVVISIGSRTVATDAFANNGVSGWTTTDNSNVLAQVAPSILNGTTWDRQRSITGAVADGTGLGVQAMEEAGALWVNITTATTTVVKSGPTILHKIVFGTLVASATVTLYNNTAASGAKVQTFTLPSTITGDIPSEIIYDLQLSTGLTVVTSGATDITLVYR